MDAQLSLGRRSACEATGTAVRQTMVQPRATVNFCRFRMAAKIFHRLGNLRIPLNLSVLGQTQDQQQLDTLYFYGNQCNPPQAMYDGSSYHTFTMPANGLQQPFLIHQRRLQGASGRRRFVC
jgi:hypothetical protein